MVWLQRQEGQGWGRAFQASKRGPFTPSIQVDPEVPGSPAALDKFRSNPRGLMPLYPAESWARKTSDPSLLWATTSSPLAISLAAQGH